MTTRVPAAILACAFALTLAACAKTDTVVGSAPTGLSFPLPADPAAAIANAGLSAMSAEGTLVHIHAHLDVSVNGNEVDVPAKIGIAGGTISPLHTHDISGVIHIEANSNDTFTVGQLFTEWGVKLDEKCLSAFCADDKNELVAYVNGVKVTGNPASIPFHRHDEIFISWGPKGATPPIPPNYTFPEGS
jgi:hypothetical protein